MTVNQILSKYKFLLLVVCEHSVIGLGSLPKHLTFDLQVDVILVVTKGVLGHAGVFTIISSLSYVNF